MLTRTRTKLLTNRESGAALVAALTVVTTVGLLSMMTFQLNQSTWQRQLTENDKKRAFYLAEAAMAESMAAITLGLGGNIGSKAEPAEFGEGFFYAEALEDQWGLLQIDAYGICGGSRHHLALAIDKLHVPLAREGFFGEQFVEIGAGVTVDSAADPGSGGGSGVPPSTVDGRTEEVLVSEEPRGGELLGGEGGGLVTKGVVGTGESGTLETTTVKPDSDSRQLVKFDEEPWKVAWMGGGELQLNTWDLPEPTGEKYATGVPFDLADLRPTAPADTTAKVGSNGSITIDPGVGTTTMLDASVHPGPGETVTPGVGVVITGATTPRTVAEALPTLPVPTVDPAGDLIVPTAGTQQVSEPYAEYGTLSVGGNATLTLVGPGQVVCTTLQLAPGAVLVIDSSTGPVELHVRDSATLGAGAEIQSPTQDATGLLLFVHGVDATVGVTEKVVLSGAGTLHGLLYAPFAHLELPSTMSFVGSAIARSLTVQANTSLTFEPALLNESYSALVLDPVAWIVDTVPEDLDRRVYDPDLDYKTAGVVPPLPADSWQETEQVLRFQDADGKEYIYRGNVRTPAEVGATAVVDDLRDTDSNFDAASVPPGRIQGLDLP